MLHQGLILIRWVFSILLSLVFAAPHAYGLAKAGHEAAENEVFGFTDARSREVLKPLWDLVQDKIIDPEGNTHTISAFRKRLTTEFPEFRWGKDGHRVLFHWGFNVLASNYPPLQERVARSFGNNTERIQAFYKVVLDEQIKRNGLLIGKITEVTGLQSEPARAMATLVWDVHILADYTTSAKKGLPKLDILCRDISEAGIGRLQPAREDPALKKESQQKLRAAVDDPEKMRDVLREYLPRLMQASWKNTLAKKGITVTVAPSPLRVEDANPSSGGCRRAD